MSLNAILKNRSKLKINHEYTEDILTEPDALTRTKDTDCYFVKKERGRSDFRRINLKKRDGSIESAYPTKISNMRLPKLQNKPFLNRDLQGKVNQRLSSKYHKTVESEPTCQTPDVFST